MYRQNHCSSSKLQSLVEVLGLLKQYQEFGKQRKLKRQQILWGGSVSATRMECFLISPLNCIRNINFFLYSFFLKYRALLFSCLNNLSKRSYAPSFLKAVLSAERLSFIKTAYREIQIQAKALYKFYRIVQICTVIKNC